MQTNKPNIQRVIYEGKKLIEFVAKKIPKQFGKGAAHIIVPKELIGKVIDVSYKEESNGI